MKSPFPRWTVVKVWDYLHHEWIDYGVWDRWCGKLTDYPLNESAAIALAEARNDETEVTL
jgi:hypothetical protein